MSYPNIIEFQNNLINLIYPIGSIYMSVNNVSPETFLGGTWEQIEDTFLLASGSTYSAGSTGGEATHTLSVNETPAHTHTRGTMNITGNIYAGGTYGSDIFTTATGAFVNGGQTSWRTNTLQYAEAGASAEVFLDASRSWTGATSSVGGNAAHNNMPPYLAVYMWKRIS